MTDDQILSVLFEAFKELFGIIFNMIKGVFDILIIPLAKECWEFAKGHPKITIIFIISMFIGAFIENLLLYTGHSHDNEESKKLADVMRDRDKY